MPPKKQTAAPVAAKKKPVGTRKPAASASATVRNAQRGTTAGQLSRVSPGQCEKWRRDPTINPVTGNTFKAAGQKYKALLAKCGAPY